MRTMFDRFLRISSMFMLMMSLVHCDALDLSEMMKEEQECTLGEVQPCDCIEDGQVALGTQVCDLSGEFGG